jgi:hypothetical protein
MPGIPEIKGKISGIINDNATKGCSVTYTDVSAADAQAYMDGLKAKGFGDGMESSTSDGLPFTVRTAKAKPLCSPINTSNKKD